MIRWLFAMVVVAGAGAGVWWVVKDSHWIEPQPLGDLTVSPYVLDTPSYAFGPFTLTFAGSTELAQVGLSHESSPQLLRYDTVAGRAFVGAAQDATTFHEHRGMISISPQIMVHCADQTIDQVRASGTSVVLEGLVVCPGRAVPYTLTLTAIDNRTVGFDLQTEEPNLNRLYFGMASTPTEAFIGFGAQFSHVNMKGKRVPLVVSEQGVGRGAQPLTMGADLQAGGAGGDWWTTYAPVPHTITSRNRSVALLNHEPAAFDLRRDALAIVEVYAPRMIGRLYVGNSPKELIQAHTAWAGRMRPLPDWIMSGAIIGLQGGTARVREVYEQLQAANVPIAGLWLQDWVGQRQTSFGQQLWWSWTLDQNRYPGWDDLMADLQADGVNVLSYVNPFLVDVAGRTESDYRNLYQEAAARGYLVTKDGAPYPLTNTDFEAGLVDLTNPDARAWLIDLIRTEVAGTGVRGWMADFGEALPFDADLHGDYAADTEHNRYPEAWAALNREAIEGLPNSDEYVFFMRSAHTRSPAYSTLFWLGDQMVDWDPHDGLKSAVTGMVTSGLSGMSLTHSDIGGYTTITHPLRDYHRSAELLKRWAEFSAFTPIFRTHEGNLPAANHQVYSDAQTLAHFASMARVYACWLPYRKDLVAEAARTGIPLIRHPWLEFPTEPELLTLSYEQFMVGEAFMVAPVTTPEVDTVMVTFPAGGDPWVHLFTGEVYGPGDFQVHAPLGQPAAFGRQGHPMTQAVSDCIARI